MAAYIMCTSGCLKQGGHLCAIATAHHHLESIGPSFELGTCIPSPLTLIPSTQFPSFSAQNTSFSSSILHWTSSVAHILHCTTLHPNVPHNCVPDSMPTRTHSRCPPACALAWTPTRPSCSAGRRDRCRPRRHALGVSCSSACLPCRTSGARRWTGR